MGEGSFVGVFSFLFLLHELERWHLQAGGNIRKISNPSFTELTIIVKIGSETGRSACQMMIA